jgi:hypothetical protein
MAFNNLGPLTQLAPGQSAYWWYNFNGGVGDQGTQFASADIQSPGWTSPHTADLQQKQLDNSGNATYYVRITNQGPGICNHNLQGGGMS